MPLELIRKIRNSELPSMGTKNEAKATEVLDDGSRQKVKLRKLKLIKPQDVKDYQPIPLNSESEQPWETVTNGIYQKDAPSLRQKMQNGYQYELGNKFPMQYQWKEIIVEKVEEKEPISIDCGLPLLRAMTGQNVIPERKSLPGTPLRRFSVIEGVSDRSSSFKCRFQNLTKRTEPKNLKLQIIEEKSHDKDYIWGNEEDMKPSGRVSYATQHNSPREHFSDLNSEHSAPQ
jgi:hypothetical protein